MPLLQVNDIELWSDRQGRGDPLLVITGTGADLRKKPNVLSSPLTQAFDVAAFDQRGLGRSSKPDGPYTMRDYADDAAGVLDRLGWESAHVVGISFGGMVAQELALRHASRLRRLVLCCTSPGGAGGASYPLHHLQHLSARDRALQMMRISDVRHDDAWSVAHPQEHEQLLSMAMEDPYRDEPRRALGQLLQIEARAAHDAWDRLAQIQCPTLICGGRYDAIASPETQENMARRIPNSTLRFFDGGHLFTQQDPAAFPGIIAFLQGEAI